MEIGRALEGLFCACCAGDQETRTAAQQIVTRGIPSGGVASCLIDACTMDLSSVSAGIVLALQVCEKDSCIYS